MVTSNNVVTFIVSSENTWDVINSSNATAAADTIAFSNRIEALQLSDAIITTRFVVWTFLGKF